MLSVVPVQQGEKSQSNLEAAVKGLVCLALAAWVAVLLAQRIDLTTADLGRHIANGSMILGSPGDRDGVLHTNFYSYTMAGQPFINHHWLTGVVFFLIWKSFGFTGLSVWNVAFGVIAFGLFFDVARRAGNFWLASAVSICLMPLITARSEVRPETFTYFLTGLFVWILWLHRARKLGRRWLYGLPLAMLIWVNLHIGFVFGFLVLGGFLLEASMPLVWGRLGLGPKAKGSTAKARMSGKKSRDSAAAPPPPVNAIGEWKQLAGVSVLCALAGLVNPFFLQGFLYPLSIFGKYGYLVAENQSIPFLERLGVGGNNIFLIFRLTAAAMIVSGAMAAMANRRKVDVALLTPALASGVMAYFAIRNFITFGLFAVPALAATLNTARHPIPGRRIGWRDAILMGVFAIAISGVLWQQYDQFPQVRAGLGLGLVPGADASADFMKQNHITGPIFNDYDVGGYLIYKLSMDGPRQSVFVDNRPEAYSVEFFRDVYIPAQRDEAQWQQLDRRYHFNAIFFSRRDATAWARTFLDNRARDRAWAPVFADDYNIIFLRRDNLANRDTIGKSTLVVRPVE